MSHVLDLAGETRHLRRAKEFLEEAFFVVMLASGFHWVGIGRNCGRFAGHSGACVWTADFVVRR